MSLNRRAMFTNQIIRGHVIRLFQQVDERMTETTPIELFEPPTNTYPPFERMMVAYHRPVSTIQYIPVETDHFEVEEVRLKREIFGVSIDGGRVRGSLETAVYLGYDEYREVMLAERQSFWLLIETLEFVEKCSFANGGWLPEPEQQPLPEGITGNEPGLGGTRRQNGTGATNR